MVKTSAFEGRNKTPPHCRAVQKSLFSHTVYNLYHMRFSNTLLSIIILAVIAGGVSAQQQSP